jgi:hypothetical protein
MLLETYPSGAWRSLGLVPLRAKSKVKSDDVPQGCDMLQRLMKVYIPGTPTHDELQALVAGLAGVAVANGNPSGYEAVGAPLHEVGGVMREGYIVNPTAECLSRPGAGPVHAGPHGAQAGQRISYPRL